MQLLLQQMQQATTLLDERLARSTPGSSTFVIPATTTSHQTPATNSTLKSPPSQTTASVNSNITHQTPFSYPASRMSLGPARSQRAQDRFSPYSASVPCSSYDAVQTNLARLFHHNATPRSRYRGGSRGGKKEVPWNHFFVCLPEPDMTSVPNPEEARCYESCGIGKKVVCFANNQGDHAYLAQELYQSFPPLREAGGFTLATSDRSKMLKKITIPPFGYTIPFLRHHAEIKRAPLYIIPLQKGLTLIPPVLEASIVFFVKIVIQNYCCNKKLL